MNSIVHQLALEYPTTDQDKGVSVLGMHEDRTELLRPALELLFGGAAFVFLIALVNAANLLLSRAVTRFKEIAIRASLGAGKMRLARQVITESMLLALVGGAAGFFLTAAGILLLRAALSGFGESNEIPYIQQVTADGAVLGFTLLVSVLAGAFFGLAPALQIFSASLTGALKEGSSVSPRAQRFRSAVLLS